MVRAAARASAVARWPTIIDEASPGRISVTTKISSEIATSEIRKEPNLYNPNHTTAYGFFMLASRKRTNDRGENSTPLTMSRVAVSRLRK